MGETEPDDEAPQARLDRLDAEIARLAAERERAVSSLLRDRAPVAGAFPAEGFFVVAGPCAVDAHLEETIAELASIGILWVRAGAWKPRTFPWTFQGQGFEGLKLLRETADRYHLRIVSEVLSEADAERAVPLIDVVQVGARNCQNFALLKRLGELGRPVLLKRGASCTVEEWLGAAAYLDGRVPLTLCERGVRGFDPAFRNLLDLPGALLAKRLGGYQTIIDPSHGTGLPALVAPMVHAARACGLDGAMLEVHADPRDSASDGDQALRLSELRDLMAELRVAPALSRSASRGSMIVRRRHADAPARPLPP
jgi:3-deoxy-7-phosphoheptulonate synthase